MKQLVIFLSFVTFLCIPSSIFGETKSLGSSLNSQQQSYIAIAGHTAQGNLNALEISLNSGLDAGLTINQIKETLIHVYAYAGFPRSIRGLQTFMVVLEDRKSRGIIDEIGADITSIKDQQLKYDRGKAILEQLTGIQDSGTLKGYASFAPTIEKFLKEHLFADIFERDILSHKERELITISVLSTIGGVEPQLQSHLNICINLGYTKQQLEDFIAHIAVSIGKVESQNARIVLDQVLKN